MKTLFTKVRQAQGKPIRLGEAPWGWLKGGVKGPEKRAVISPSLRGWGEGAGTGTQSVVGEGCQTGTGPSVQEWGLLVPSPRRKELGE